MAMIGLLIIVLIVLAMVIAILWSVIEGVMLMVRSDDVDQAHQRSMRMLA